MESSTFRCCAFSTPSATAAGWPWKSSELARLRVRKRRGLEDADATDLGEMIASRQSPALVAFRARAGDAGATRTLSVNVARYDQQAVLMANIEEARYDVLMSADGKELVQARYAVRNNQRNFVKIALPPGASVWSATLGGRPVRPGQSPDGSLLLPLEKSRGGEDAPAFVVEIDVRHEGSGVAGQGARRQSRCLRWTFRFRAPACCSITRQCSKSRRSRERSARGAVPSARYPRPCRRRMTQLGVASVDRDECSVCVSASRADRAGTVRASYRATTKRKKKTQRRALLDTFRAKSLAAR